MVLGYNAMSKPMAYESRNVSMGSMKTLKMTSNIGHPSSSMKEFEFHGLVIKLCYMTPSLWPCYEEGGWIEK